MHGLGNHGPIPEKYRAHAAMIHPSSRPGHSGSNVGSGPRRSGTKPADTKPHPPLAVELSLPSLSFSLQTPRTPRRRLLLSISAAIIARADAGHHPSSRSRSLLYGGPPHRIASHHLARARAPCRAASSIRLVRQLARSLAPPPRCCTAAPALSPVPPLAAAIYTHHAPCCCYNAHE